jgi:SAM-dependent methyltransferase
LFASKSEARSPKNAEQQLGRRSARTADRRARGYIIPRVRLTTMPRTPTPTMTELQALFSQIDIYLFDQLLRGRVPPGARICDAGCGSGRNLVYFLRAGYDVRAVDADPSAVATVRSLAAALAPTLPGGNFRAEPVDAMSFPDGCVDFVISSAVLHFARDDDHFEAMLRECWRLLDRNGVLFCRLASSIGIESRVRALGSGRFALPDGTERYLVTEARLMDLTTQLGGELIDPLKTTVVQNLRSMTTWVMRRA